MLPRARHLDVRPAAEAARAPLRDAVNIPLNELPQRVYELPPHDETTLVANTGEEAAAAVRWLGEQERAAQLVDGTQPAAPSERAAAGRLWAPNAFLEEVAPQLPQGTALDIACGVGREAVFLKSLGWRVAALDALDDALARGHALEDRYSPGEPAIDWVQRDVERAGVGRRGAFELVTAFRFLHRPLFAELIGALAPGGSLLVETFTTLHRATRGRPQHDAYVLQPGELPALAAGLRIVSHDEAWRGRAHTARLWARKE